MKLKNVNCVLEGRSIINTSDGVHSYHLEQWYLVSRETKKYIGFVTFEKCIPDVSSQDKEYNMYVTVEPVNSVLVHGFDYSSKHYSRVELLNKAIDFVQNI